jgi:two-component system, response regulator YesN
MLKEEIPLTKILIVDDELLVRIGIIHAVDWGQNGYEIVGEAADGKSALQMIDKLSPDIVLLDINLPVMSGLDVLKQIRQKNAPCKVVILSYHEEFEFVKEALKNGAYDYILKHNMNNNQMLDVLNKARDSIIEENKVDRFNKKFTGNMDTVNKLLKRDKLLCMIKGKKIDGIDIKINLNPCCLYCLVFEMDDFQSVKMRYDNGDVGLLTEALLKMEEETIASISEHELLELKENRFALLVSFSKSASERLVKEKLNEICKMLMNTSETYANVNISIGISSRKDGFEYIGVAYNEAEMALSQKFTHYDRQIFDYDDIQGKEEFGDFKAIYAIEDEIKKLLADKNYSLVLDAFHRYFSKLQTLKVVNATRVLDFVGNAVRFSSFCNEQSDEETDGLPANCYNVDILQAFVEKYFQKQLGENNDYDYYAKKAVKYIQEHYREQINLSSISDYLGLSESHTSRLFNKNIKMSIPDYINLVRIKKAKELIMGTTMKIYEISEYVGFKSPVHFNIVFKKLVYSSPLEFRSKGGDVKL